jgi:hypothetical protein
VWLPPGESELSDEQVDIVDQIIAQALEADAADAAERGLGDHDVAGAARRPTLIAP